LIKRLLALHRSYMGGINNDLARDKLVVARLMAAHTKTSRLDLPLA